MGLKDNSALPEGKEIRQHLLVIQNGQWSWKKGGRNEIKWLHP